MIAVWTGLTTRERALVWVMASLTILVFCYLLIWRPLLESRDAALQNQASAEALYRFVTSAVDEAKKLRSSGRGQPAGQETQSLRVILAATARTAGISISRIQPGARGGLTIWLDRTNSQQLYSWLTMLAQKHHLAPQKVSLQKAGAGAENGNDDPSRAGGNLRGQLQFGGVD